VINPPDRQIQTLKFTVRLFMFLALVGTIGFHFFRFEMLGGLGLAFSLFGLVSWFHFRKREKERLDAIETKFTWFLLALVMVGILIFGINVRMKGPEFYNGIAGGLIFMCGLTYALELFLNWMASVR